MSNYLENAEKRKQARLSNMKALRADSNDMLSTKAMISILAYITNNTLSSVELGVETLMQELKEDSKVNETTLKILKEIEKQREVSKELDLKLLDKDEIKNLIKELNPNNYEENMKDLRNAIKNQDKELNLNMIFEENKAVEEIKAAMKENVNRNQQRIN